MDARLTLALFRRTIIVTVKDSGQDFSCFWSSLFTNRLQGISFLKIIVLDKNRLSFDILIKAVHQPFPSKHSTSLLIFYSLLWLMETQSCVKSVRICSFSGPCFPAFGLNPGRFSVSPPIQFECRKMRTRKTPSTHTFYAVNSF